MHLDIRIGFRQACNMCGRFVLIEDPDAVVEEFGVNASKSSFSEPRYNVCPTQSIPVAVAYDGQRHLVDMRWGFIPHWYKKPSDGPLLINARSETLAQKPAFREAARARRCLIPASGFYEWHRDKGTGKEPWFLKRPAKQILAFAGVWQAWTSPEGERQVSGAIVTTAAGNDISHIHHREPVTLARDDYGLWLGEEGMGAAKLMKTAPDGFYDTYRVSDDVNSRQNNTSQLMEPMA